MPPLLRMPSSQFSRKPTSLFLSERNGRAQREYSRVSGGCGAHWLMSDFRNEHLILHNAKADLEGLWESGRSAPAFLRFCAVTKWSVSSPALSSNDSLGDSVARPHECAFCRPQPVIMTASLRITSFGTWQNQSWASQSCFGSFADADIVSSAVSTRVAPALFRDVPCG